MPSDQPTRRFRLRFSLRQLFLAVALVAIGLAVAKWAFRKEVVVRAATAEDEVFADESLASQRNAAVVTGSFTKGTALSVSFQVVKVGTVKYTSVAVFARDESVGGLHWADVSLSLSLGERIVPGGSMTDLMTTWNTEDGINGWQQIKTITHDINVVATKTLSGTITPGKPHIVYVEGDRPIVVDGNMSVEDFAKANPGNYLVVTVEVK